MHKINRVQNPTFTKYNDGKVQIALKLDFNKKCYICEESTRHYQIDHFYPKSHYPHLENSSYENLFYSCEKCNNLKSNSINTSSENEILDCTKIEVEHLIKLKYIPKTCNVEISKIKDCQNKKENYKIYNTIEFLEKIYNGKNTKSTSCEDLKDEIKNEIEEFRKLLDKYQKSKLKSITLKEIKASLEISSSYSTFKYWIVKDNKRYENIFKSN